MAVSLRGIATPRPAPPGLALSLAAGAGVALASVRSAASVRSSASSSARFGPWGSELSSCAFASNGDQRLAGGQSLAFQGGEGLNSEESKGGENLIPTYKEDADKLMERAACGCARQRAEA